jgi:hypothetical protein
MAIKQFTSKTRSRAQRLNPSADPAEPYLSSILNKLLTMRSDNLSAALSSLQNPQKPAFTRVTNKL